MTRRRRLLLVVALVAIVLLLALKWLAQPSNLAGLVTSRAGAALGLEIRAAGTAEYRLRGAPMLVLRDVTAREPGAKTQLLAARRIYVELPWSTLRSGGEKLVATRVELDAPRLDLPALQHWLATRPPSAKRLPTLTHGLRIRDGAIHNNDWDIDGIHVDLPLLSTSQPLRARLRGRYVDPTLAIPVDLAVAIVRPEALIKSIPTGFATHGRITLKRGREWSMPATVTLSGPLRLGEDDLRITPAHLAMAATLETAEIQAPFALGVHGPLHFDEATWILGPAGIALRGRGDKESEAIPDFDAHGSLSLGHQLGLHIEGDLADWPPGWPALPPPIGQSRSPLPFALDYRGAPAFGDNATLRLQRDATRFDGHFRLPQVLDWIAQAQGSPLPPMTGTLVSPQIEISGAKLEGVEVQFEDDAVTP